MYTPHTYKIHLKPPHHSPANAFQLMTVQKTV